MAQETVGIERQPLVGEVFGNRSRAQLKRKSVRGGMITLTTQALTFVVQTGSTVVLARLLSPKDYGLQGMVLAVTGVLGLFRDGGLGLAVVQREEVTHEQLSTVFWINVTIGAALTVLTLALAPVLVVFYKEPRLLWITFATASSFLLSGIATVHGAFLVRDMRFATLAKIGVSSLLLSTAVGLGMAALGCGYWSLVMMALSGSAIGSCGYWLSVPWRPGRPSRKCGIRSMLHFGGTVTLNNLVVYLGYNAEKVLLGRFWGADALGLYGRAYQLINLPLQQLHSSMYSVAFPALSRIQNDHQRLCSTFLKGYSVALSLTIPVMISSILFADEVIRLVLGPKWISAVPILRLLGPTILAFGLINPFGWFLMATGRQVRSLNMALVIAPTVILGILLGLRRGPAGVALGYSVAMTVLIVPLIAWAIKGTGIRPRDYLKAIKPSMLAGVVACAAGIGVKLALGGAFTTFARLALGLGLVLSIYAWILLVTMGQKNLYVDLVRHALRRNPPIAGEGTAQL
jgi:O-antigen/teichoic acid export membrane protein